MSQDQLTNLMRWRLEQDLDCKTTLVFQVTNTVGSGIIDMIFAADRWAGGRHCSDCSCE